MIEWNGNNAHAVYLFLCDAAGFHAPRDWVEEMPDGRLMLMGDDRVVFVKRGQRVGWCNRIIVLAAEEGSR